MQPSVTRYNPNQNITSYVTNPDSLFNSTSTAKMSNFNVFQPNKQQNTATQVPPQIKLSSTPARLLSSKSKVLDDSFLYPDSDDDGVIDADSDEYELTDDELLDYGRPGRRRAAKKQGLVPGFSEDGEKAKSPGSRSSEVSKIKENRNGTETKPSTDVLRENEVRITFKDKTNVTQKKPGFLSGFKR